MEAGPRLDKSIGLTSVEARARLKKYGRNEIVSQNSLGQFQQFLRILSDPMGLMMLGLAVLYFLTGDSTDAVIILIAYIPVTAVDVFLELRSERALKALQSSLQTTAKVFRDGVLEIVPVPLIVPGDVLAFEEGQSLPADGQILECHNLSVNESALTGESLPIEKAFEQKFFAGTTVLAGRGIGLVFETGKNTQFGKISHLIEETPGEESPLQKKVHSLVKKVLVVAGILVLFLFGLEYFRGSGLLKSLITALTFGMAAVPEEFPLVFTLYLSLGAWRLSKHGVLVKTLPSVESLGNVDVICTDKTGTLTEGRFSLINISPFGELTEAERERIALLACEKTPVDSMEMAIVRKVAGFDELQKNWSLTWDYPFENQGKHMTHVWTSIDGTSVLAMKGAVEGVLEHSKVSAKERAEILKESERLASQGKRILGLASKKGTFSGQRHLDEKEVEFVGLLVFSDPIRPSAERAIEACQNAGIEIKMLTGDHLLTAHAIADELKISHTEASIFSGAQLSHLNSAERAQAFLKGSVFARVTPEQKFEMVKTLKDHGKIVAMTGDGVNDSPALKLADIGVSMGENATDVARSTAKMVLMRNDFNGIVHAVFEGRKIFANLRRSFSYLIAFHVPVVLLALLPPLLGWPQLLLPVHIILLELIVHPISAFAFENLKEQPLRPGKNLVPTSIVLTAVLSGVLVTLCALASTFMIEGQRNFDQVRSLALSTVLFGNIGFTLAEAWPHLKSFRLVGISVALFFLPLLLSQTLLGKQFYLAPLENSRFILAFFLGLGSSIPCLWIRRKFEI